MKIDIESIAPLAAVIFVTLLLYLKKRRRRTSGYLICFTIFYIYLTCVVGYTILPLPFDPEFFGRDANLMSRINLIPLRDMSVDYLLSVQGVGNIVLGIPFGFGLPFLLKSDFKSILWRGLFFTLSIEFVQLVILLFFSLPYRTMDINDVLLNLSGVMIGYALFFLFSWIYRKSAPEYEPGGVWIHIHTVLTNQGAKPADQSKVRQQAYRGYPDH